MFSEVVLGIKNWRWSGGGTGGGNGGPGPCGANETGAHQGRADKTAET